MNNERLILIAIKLAEKLKNEGYNIEEIDKEFNINLTDKEKEILGVELDYYDYVENKIKYYENKMNCCAYGKREILELESLKQTLKILSER